MLTQTGSTLGTAGSTSPEQARGDEVDRRSDVWGLGSDVWGLGVVLYEMIIGRLPFGGEYEQALVYSILNAEPEPLTALRSGIPIALDGVIAKALAKDPDMRYQHVDEIPADIKAVQAGTASIASRIAPAVSSVQQMSAVSTAATAAPTIHQPETAPKRSNRAPIKFPVSLPVRVPSLHDVFDLRRRITQGIIQEITLETTTEL